MRLPWVSRRRYEELQDRYAWAYEKGQLQGNADARKVFRERIEELESYDADAYLSASHNGAEAMRAACIEAVPHHESCLSFLPDFDYRDCGCHRRDVVAALREVQP